MTAIFFSLHPNHFNWKALSVHCQLEIARKNELNEEEAEGKPKRFSALSLKFLAHSHTMASCYHVFQIKAYSFFNDMHKLHMQQPAPWLSSNTRCVAYVCVCVCVITHKWKFFVHFFPFHFIFYTFSSHIVSGCTFFPWVMLCLQYSVLQSIVFSNDTHI